MFALSWRCPGKKEEALRVFCGGVFCLTEKSICQETLQRFARRKAGNCSFHQPITMVARNWQMIAKETGCVLGSPTSPSRRAPTGPETVLVDQRPLQLISGHQIYSN